MSAEAAPLLEARGVSKRYGATVALDSVDFSVRAGEVSVLIGENGAGKSTLMRILAGVEQPTSGQLLLDGEEVAFANVREASARGIGIVHQELSFCPNLSVAENIFLNPRSSSRDKGSQLLLAPTKEIAAARALLERLEQPIDPTVRMGDLRIGQQQIVEIAKAVAEECRVLILDEPTSALSDPEVKVLFRLIEDLKRAGVAIVYISHRLEELLKIGDTITVLRDGKLVDRAPVAQASLEWIVERMLGELGRPARKSARNAPGPEVLTLDNLHLNSGNVSYRGLSASFRAGEITAVFGLLGAGRTELLEAISGLRPIKSGTILLNGDPIEGLLVAHRVRKGLLLVPEDRQRDGLFPNLTVGRNIGISDLRQAMSASGISRRRETSVIARMMQRLGVKAASGEADIASLSGGNQQKVVIGRSLLPGPSAILLDEPSRGVDVGARAEIFSTMQQLADDGLAVVFATSDVIEALAIADRILVVAGGTITADTPAHLTDEPTLIRAANASHITEEDVRT